MSNQVWDAVDGYYADLLLGSDPALEAILQASEAAGLPAIQVSPLQGKLLQLLVQMQGARKVLEVGTLGGYSALWLARGLSQGGRLVTLELSPKHAEVARANLARAGVGDRVEVRQGNAEDSLAQLIRERSGPFDLIFIDADKPGYTRYFELALQLSRPGTVIVADNVVRDGAVVEPSHPDERVQGVRRFADRVAAEKRVSATAIQTVGSKGYDGFLLARVLEG